LRDADEGRIPLKLRPSFFAVQGEKGKKRERMRDEGEKKKCHARLQVLLSTYILTDQYAI